MICPERSNTEIIYLNEMEVDLGVRIELIKGAKVSIDIITFSQATDRTGKLFLSAVREAQKKYNVKVRFICDSLASYIDRDFTARSAKMLKEKYTEFYSIGYLDKIKNGLCWDDFFHEKVLIIDADTDKELIVTGGRGYTDFSTQTADSGYIIRPVEFGKPYLGDDIKSNFNRILKEIKGITKPVRIKKEKAFEEIDNFFCSNLLHREKIKGITEYISHSGYELNESFKPEKVRLFTNDAVSFILSEKRKVKDRDSLINEAHDQLIHDIDRFNGKIFLTSYSIGFPESLFKAFKRFVERGNTLNLVTNGRKSHREFVWFGTPFYYTIEVLRDFLLETSDMKGQTNVYFLDAFKAGLLNEMKFTHRKLILLENSDITYTGTDNFTWSASRKNNEWLIKITDKELNGYLSNILSTELEWYRRVEIDEILNTDLKRKYLYRFTRGIIRRNY